MKFNSVDFCMKSSATHSGWVAQVQMHIEMFVFDMPDETPGMNNFSVPGETKKKKKGANCTVLREQLQLNKVCHCCRDFAKYKTYSLNSV